MIAHGPVFGAKVTGFDAKAARAIPGVVDVKQVPTGVAVYATNTWAARRGRDALQVQWDLGPGARVSTEAMRTEYRALVAKPGQVVAKNGDVDAALQGSKKVVEAEYELPYLAHACMEPLNVCVEVQPDKCEIWTGTQGQSEARRMVAEDLGFKPEQVFVHTMFLGGGFGRRANPLADNVREAAQIAKAMPGKPVLTVWTREDDMKAGYYRPFAMHHLRGALDDKGVPVAWLHRVAAQSIMDGTPFGPMVAKIGFDPTSVEGASDMAYVVPNRRVELHTVKSPVTVQYWRSVGHSHTAFAVNTFIDELAAAASKDPVDVRRAMLADKPRHRAVLEKAVEAAGWGKPLPAGRARGIALHESFGSIVAEVVEVSIENGEPRVHRVVCAVDCGYPINPDNIAAQMESAVVYGLSAALRGQITLKNGEVQQQNFDTYDPLRINEMPVVETHIVETGGPLGGIGEPGTPPIAPAVCNALFALTGKRIRRLPISDSLKA
jgi:isoquinoline 1-oxidoreductase beta subunit